jgi:hypothetical protein
MFRLLIAALLVSTPAIAGKDDPTWNPPARYDHQYQGNLTVQYLPQKQVVAACERLFIKYKVKAKASMTQRGCAATTAKGSCTVIVIDKPYALATPKAVLRHERGHCNGWPSSHPD